MNSKKDCCNLCNKDICKCKPLMYKSKKSANDIYHEARYEIARLRILSRAEKLNW